MRTCSAVNNGGLPGGGEKSTDPPLAQETFRTICDFVGRMHQPPATTSRSFNVHDGLSLTAQDQRAAIERRMKETIDEMVSAFDRHLEDSAASTKQHFRWMKRRYREKIDINRAASRIELKVGGQPGSKQFSHHEGRLGIR